MEEIKLSVIQEEDIALSHELALRGDKGTTFHPSVSEDGVISWTNDGNEINPDPINIRGPQGFIFTPQMNDSIIQWTNNGGLDNPPPVDIRGPIGYVYTPTLSSDGILSWTNNGGLQNPNSVSLVGPRGPQGEPFTIAKTFISVEEMNAGFDTDSVLEGSFVMIDTGDVEDPDNAKLYCKGQTGYVYITDLSGAQGIKGEKGEAFTFNDFTQEQLALLKGEKGDPFTYDDFTTEQLAELKGEKGDPFTYDDFTPEQIASLKGEKGDAFLYSDFTDEQLAALKGEKGDAFTYNDFTPEQIADLKGDKGDAFTYDDFTTEQLAALKGEPFTYNDFTEEQLAGLVGPKGDTGSGIELKGTYDTEESFRADHPASIPPTSMGDAYYVAGDLFTWDGSINDWVNRGAIQGPKGDPFTFDDFTEEQLALLKGEKGDPFIYSDFTEDQLALLKGEKGDPFVYDDFTSEQLVALKGEKGDAFTFDDFTESQLESLRGPQGIQGIQGVQGKRGEKGDPFTIAKTFRSIDEMNAGFDTDGIAEGSFVMIDTGNVEDEDDAKLFVKGTTAYSFITDLSGASGIKGEKGDAFTYADFTSEQLAALKGDKGDAFKYSDFTEEQLAALKGSPGEKGEPLTYDDMTQEQKNALKDAVIADMGGSLEDYATKEYVEQNGGKINSLTIYGSSSLPIDENKNVDLELSNVQIVTWGENDTSETVGIEEVGTKTVYIGPSALSELSEDTTHRLVTDAQIAQWSTSLYPSLSDVQKSEMKSLMDAYLAKKASFIYDGSFRRESYAYPNSVSSLSDSIEGCMYNDQYILNCGLFAQMIWMGRSIDDFTPTPSTNITKAFDWGYYFNFTAAKKAYGVMKDESTYYSGNTYINDNGGTSFVSFDNAAAMAQELYRKGFEVPYGKVEVGDLIFYRSRSITDNSTDTLEQTSFKYITHVAIVYDITDDGPTIIECTNAFTNPIGKSGLGDDVTRFGNVRGADLENRVVMAVRHPAAFGISCNVPDIFTIYRGTEVKA